MSDSLWMLTELSADLLVVGLGVLATVATVAASGVSAARGRRIAACCFGLAAVLFTPGLVLVGPFAPDPTEALAQWLSGPAPTCGPEMCGTMCMHLYESWLDEARTLLWTGRTVADALATGLLLLGFRLR